MTQQATVEKRAAGATRPERVRASRTFVPVVDILERPDELLLIADVPGAIAENIDVQYENGLLTLTAGVRPRQDDKETYLLCEYGVGDFSRSFEIGEGIDAAKIAAEVKDGVLTLHLPKAEANRPRKIAVK